jgi:hypothetical protein
MANQIGGSKGCRQNPFQFSASGSQGVYLVVLRTQDEYHSTQGERAKSLRTWCAAQIELQAPTFLIVCDEHGILKNIFE